MQREREQRKRKRGEREGERESNSGGGDELGTNKTPPPASPEIEFIELISSLPFSKPLNVRIKMNM